MTKLKKKHIKFLRERVEKLDKFLPLTKSSLTDLFHHLNQSSTMNITNDIGTEEPFDPEFRKQVEDFITDIDPDDFDFADANTRLDQ